MSQLIFKLWYQFTGLAASTSDKRRKENRNWKASIICSKESVFTLKLVRCLWYLCVCLCLCALRGLECDKKSFLSFLYYRFQSKKFESHHIWPSPGGTLKEPYKNCFISLSFNCLKKKLLKNYVHWVPWWPITGPPWNLGPWRSLSLSLKESSDSQHRKRERLSQLLAGLELSCRANCGEFLRIPGWDLCSLVPCSMSDSRCFSTRATCVYLRIPFWEASVTKISKATQHIKTNHRTPWLPKQGQEAQ